MHYGPSLFLMLPFKCWMEGEEAYENLERMRELVKLEQFANCLPMEIARLAVEKHSKLVAEAAKLADEYAAFYRPFKLEQHQTFERAPKKLAERGKFFHTLRVSGRESQGTNFRPLGMVCVAQIVAEADTLLLTAEHICTCIGQSRHHVLEPPTVVQPVTTSQILPTSSRLSKVHDRYAPCCATATLCTNDGIRRDTIFLRDSGSLQSLASEECFRREIF